MVINIVTTAYWDRTTVAQAQEFNKKQLKVSINILMQTCVLQNEPLIKFDEVAN